MENFILIAVLGVLLLYFFSSANVYKSLYKKVNEEKNIIFGGRLADYRYYDMHNVIERVLEILKKEL